MDGEVWTDDEVAYLRKHWGKTRTLDIARKLGVTMGAVQAKARRLHISLAPKAWPEEKSAMLRKLWFDGVSTLGIAARLQTTKNAVIGRAYRMDLPRRSTGPAQWKAIA